MKDKMKSQVLQGNNIDVLKTFPDNHFDSIVTDPPYGIDFLGKAWDANTGALATYQECLRVLKPGGHILAFSAARTYHHLAVTIEQAGFEIRDQVMWIYSSGFPKSQDIGKSIQRSLGVKKTKKNPNARSLSGDSLYDSGHQKETAGEDVVCTDPEAQKWSGWGTQLKPAHEPICLARKPLHKSNSIARNCQQWGVGALNIDATRVDWEPGEKEKEQAWREKYTKTNTGGPVFAEQKKNDLPVGGQTIDASDGRFPSNVIGEIPEYQKYFYCPKVSRRERHVGFPVDSKGANIDANTHGKTPFCDDCQKTFNGSNDHSACDPALKTFKEKRNQDAPDGNNHPTVKPIELMKYLIQLITPPGGKVLDPFNGSGSTGCAAVELDYDYVGIELDPKYVAIATKRIQAWYRATHNTNFDQVFEII